MFHLAHLMFALTVHHKTCIIIVFCVYCGMPFNLLGILQNDFMVEADPFKSDKLDLTVLS